MLERALEVAQRQPAVDGEALDLLELGRVRRVERDRDGRPGRGTITYTGGCCCSIVLICIGDVWVRRTTPGATQNVSDSAFAGWSSGVVQRREVVVLELDLGPLGDAVAEADEHVLDRPLRLREQVGDAPRERACRAA